MPTSMHLAESLHRPCGATSAVGKRPPSNRRPKALKKPGTPIEPGYGRTAFGDLCLEYLEVSAADIEYLEPAEVEDVDRDE